MSKDEEVREQREHLGKVVGWAEKIEDELHELIWHHKMPVFFRPGANGVAMIGLTSDLPQRGRSGYRDLKALDEKFESQFLSYCVNVKQGRPTPEKMLQSFLIRTATRGSVERWMTPLNDASERTDAPVKLRFAVDEVPLKHNGKKIVCDLLAVCEIPGGHVPVVIELKSDRQMRRLVEQVTEYAALVDRHADLYALLFGVILHEEFTFVGPCEKWIVWPRAGTERDPREDEFAAEGIRVVGYEQDGLEFRFRVGGRPSLSSHDT